MSSGPKTEEKRPDSVNNLGINCGIDFAGFFCMINLCLLLINQKKEKEKEFMVLGEGLKLLAESGFFHGEEKKEGGDYRSKFYAP